MPDLLSADELSPDERTLSRRERERLRRRRAMLRAAQAVFAEKGYAQATLEEIAERAEFGKGTLYNYFEGGKEEILFAVFERIFDHLHGLLRDAFATDGAEAAPPLRDQFHAFAVAYISFFREQQDLFMVLVKEAQRAVFSSDAESASYFKRQRERLIGELVPILEQARRKGEIREGLSAEAVAHLLVGNTERMQVVCAMERTDAFRQGEARQDDGGACAAGEALMQDPHRAADFLTTILFDGLTVS